MGDLAILERNVPLSSLLVILELCQLLEVGRKLQIDFILHESLQLFDVCEDIAGNFGMPFLVDLKG